MMSPENGQLRDGWGSRLAQQSAEVVVKAGLEALIASGVVATVLLGGLAFLMRDLPIVLGTASVLFFLLFLVAIAYLAVLRHRHRSLVAVSVDAARLRARAVGLETLVQQLRAVDLEMTALRCHSRTDPETSPDEARRDCARVVLRPVYNQLLSSRRGQISVAFHVWDENRQRFRHIVATPEFRPAERDAVSHLGRDSAAGRALHDGEPNIIRDISTPDARQHGWVTLSLHQTAGSTIQVPVFRIGGRVDGEWLGVISVHSDCVNAFGAADGDLLLEFAVKLNVIYEGIFEHGQPVDGTAESE